MTGGCARSRRSSKSRDRTKPVIPRSAMQSSRRSNTTQFIIATFEWLTAGKRRKPVPQPRARGALFLRSHLLSKPDAWRSRTCRELHVSRHLSSYCGCFARDSSKHARPRRPGEHRAYTGTACAAPNAGDRLAEAPRGQDPSRPLPSSGFAMRRPRFGSPTTLCSRSNRFLCAGESGS
jgi:hypothetical protein